MDSRDGALVLDEPLGIVDVGRGNAKDGKGIAVRRSGDIRHLRCDVGFVLELRPVRRQANAALG